MNETTPIRSSESALYPMLCRCPSRCGRPYRCSPSKTRTMRLLTAIEVCRAVKSEMWFGGPLLVLKRVAPIKFPFFLKRKLPYLKGKTRSTGLRAIEGAWELLVAPMWTLGYLFHIAVDSTVAIIMYCISYVQQRKTMDQRTTSGRAVFMRKRGHLKWWWPQTSSSVVDGCPLNLDKAKLGLQGLRWIRVPTQHVPVIDGFNLLYCRHPSSSVEVGKSFLQVANVGVAPLP